MGAVEQRLKEEKELLKKINREIIKSAKKGDFHLYWEFTGLPDSMVRSIVSQLESEGKMVKSKGQNCKIIRW